MKDVIADCAIPGEYVPAEVEKAYRRGFSQGAAICLYAAQAGIPLDEIEAWTMKVYGWRMKAVEWEPGQVVKAAFPPPDPRHSPKAGNVQDTSTCAEVEVIRTPSKRAPTQEPLG